MQTDLSKMNIPELVRFAEEQAENERNKLLNTWRSRVQVQAGRPRLSFSQS